MLLARYLFILPSVLLKFPLLQYWRISRLLFVQTSDFKNFHSLISYHQKNEVRKNQIAVHLLFVEILKEYVRRLMEYHSRNERVHFDSEEQVEMFYSAIKYYYNESMSTYNRCIRHRSSGERKEEEFEFKPFDTCCYIERLEGMEGKAQERGGQAKQGFVPFQMPELFKTSAYVPKIIHSLASKPEEERSSSLIKKQVKHQEAKQESQSNLKQKQQETSQSESSSDSETNFEDYGLKAERRTNSLIMGDFRVNGIKRKPKEEKIYLQLQNVFMKLSHNGRDTYYDRAAIQLKKIEKSEVPIEQ